MSLSREQVHEILADVVAEHFERLRGDLLAKMLELRTPRFAITPKGELFIDGEYVGDIRPLFQRVVSEALRAAGKLNGGGSDDGAA